MRSTLLLVEDDAGTRETLAEVLESHGCEVLLARDGAEALEVLDGLNRGHLPQAIILDLVMPGMTGWELRERLRHRPEWSRIPVVVTTALSPWECRMEQLQPAACLTKPYDVSTLIAQVRPFCSA